MTKSKNLILVYLGYISSFKSNLVMLYKTNEKG